MYAIIYFTDDDKIFPIVNSDGGIKIFNTFEEARKEAKEIEPNDYVRIISLEEVDDYGY